MRIVICDDMVAERKKLKEYIRRLEKDDQLELEITEFESGEALLKSYSEGFTADLLFLDIYMSGTTGVDVAKTLLEKGYDGSVVFCTTSIDHAVESYKLKADGYLVKPYSYEDFLEAIWRCRKRFEKSRKAISFVSERIEYRIPNKKISYIETSGRACAVHTTEGVYTTYKKISEFEADLKNEPSCLRVGRCYLVNMSRISRLSDDSIILDDGDEIPLPTREKKKLQQTVNDWFWKAARGGGSR